MVKSMWFFLILSWVCLVAGFVRLGCNDEMTFLAWYGGWFVSYSISVVYAIRIRRARLLRERRP